MNDGCQFFYQLTRFFGGNVLLMGDRRYCLD